jgi:anti-anti-sigma factor
MHIARFWAKIAIMSLEETSKNGMGVVSLTGRFDGATSAAYEASLLPLLEDGRPTMILDLGGVNYLSSAGIRVLLLLFKKSEALKIPLAIACPQASVAQVLSIAGLDGLLTTQPSVEAAIRAVRA